MLQIQVQALNSCNNKSKNISGYIELNECSIFCIQLS